MYTSRWSASASVRTCFRCGSDNFTCKRRPLPACNSRPLSDNDTTAASCKSRQTLVVQPHGQAAHIGSILYVSKTARAVETLARPSHFENLPELHIGSAECAAHHLDNALTGANNCCNAVASNVSGKFVTNTVDFQSSCTEISSPSMRFLSLVSAAGTHS